MERTRKLVTRAIKNYFNNNELLAETKLRLVDALNFVENYDPIGDRKKYMKIIWSLGLLSISLLIILIWNIKSYNELKDDVIFYKKRNSLVEKALIDCEVDNFLLQNDTIFKYKKRTLIQLKN